MQHKGSWFVLILFYRISIDTLRFAVRFITNLTIDITKILRKFHSVPDLAKNVLKHARKSECRRGYNRNNIILMIFQRGTAATGAILNDKRPDFLPADDTGIVRRVYGGLTCESVNPDMFFQRRRFESVQVTILKGTTFYLKKCTLFLEHIITVQLNIIKCSWYYNIYILFNYRKSGILMKLQII